MEIAWARVLPVLVSIVIIIGVAIAREYSKTLAAILVTMPLNIPLGLWIVYAGADSAAQMEPFARALMFNIAPTILFLIIVWLAARAGWGIVPMLVAGYAGWGVGLGLILILRQVLGL
jgi:hypothetical protein